ncbi:MAG: AMP-binding protein [Spirochaetaceae bacterium]|jgi:long-chain acyl-CoA synthetase|nr:AMP-binding protein [Spirochaetaceae bacterium]
MLEYKNYIADWPDMPYPNFSAWLSGIESRWQNKTAVLYRAGKQKEFSRWSFTRLAQEAQRIGRGLLAMGMVKGDRIALWSENKPEWITVWLGAAIAGLVIVPIDFLVSENECLNILKMTKARVLFYSTRRPEIVTILHDAGIALKVVCLGNEGALRYDTLGKDAVDQPLPAIDDIAEQDPVSIIFTSGTTGFAKGVTLSHKGIIANANAAVHSLCPTDQDVFINVLPLHHTYPTTCSFIAPLSVGSSTIIVEKLVGKVVIDDIKDGHGTFLIAVPLLYDKVMAGIDAGFKKLPAPVRWIFNILRNISLAEAKKGRIAFGRAALLPVRKKANLDSIRIMVAGGGPLSPKTADFFDSFGFNIVQGYGMSENGPLISVNTPKYKRNASVGLMVQYTDVKIIDQNEEGIGEIVVKSPSLMLGYYENEAATAEIFTDDGYLKTGDLGYKDEEGFIYINGRMKNLIVSAGGKNIYPEEIEAHFDRSRLIGEILIVGRKQKDSNSEDIFAVVVPNLEALAEDYHGKIPEAVVIHEMIKKEIEKVNRSLVSYKKIVDFTLRNEAFEKNAQQKIRRFLYKNYTNPIP